MKKWKRMAGCLLAAVLSGSMILPAATAFAAAGTLAEATGGEAFVQKTATQGTDTSTLITKNLIMAKDLRTPGVTFKFTATAIQKTATDNNGTGSAQGTANGLTAATTECPAITITDITYTAGEAGTVVKKDPETDPALNHTYIADPNGTSKLVQKTTPFMSSAGTAAGTTAALEGADFPHAGEYVYTVTESAPDGGFTDALNREKAGINYSNASYEVHFFVANKFDKTAIENGTEQNGADSLYIAAISAIRTTSNDTYEATGLTSGSYVKVNLTSGTGYNSTGNNLDFQNIYNKKAPLEISKHVAGPYADQTKYFTYTMTVTVPETGATSNKTGTYTAYLYENGTKVTTAPKDPLTGTAVPLSYSVTLANGTGTISDIKLKHNQSIKFEDNSSPANPVLPVGTIYTLTEAAAVDYTATAKITYSAVDNAGADANTTTAAFENGTSTVNTAFTVAAYDTAKTVGTDTDQTEVGEGTANKTAFLNTYKTVTPTGIVIENLPFLLLILLGFGSLFLIFASKKRRRNEEA